MSTQRTNRFLSLYCAPGWTRRQTVSFGWSSSDVCLGERGNESIHVCWVEDDRFRTLRPRAHTAPISTNGESLNHTIQLSLHAIAPIQS